MVYTSGLKYKRTKSVTKDLLLETLFSSRSSLATVFSHLILIQTSQSEGFPQFLPVDQIVEVIEGSTALLECRLANLAAQHTVGECSLEKECVTCVSGVLDEVLRPRSPDSGRAGVQL